MLYLNIRLSRIRRSTVTFKSTLIYFHPNFTLREQFPGGIGVRIRKDGGLGTGGGRRLFCVPIVALSGATGFWLSSWEELHIRGFHPAQYFNVAFSEGGLGIFSFQTPLLDSTTDGCVGGFHYLKKYAWRWRKTVHEIKYHCIFR